VSHFWPILPEVGILLETQLKIIGFDPAILIRACHPERGLFFAPKRKEQPQSKDP
jgi:hypothetical protein